jgi:hypothetical protein
LPVPLTFPQRREKLRSWEAEKLRREKKKKRRREEIAGKVSEPGFTGLEDYQD